MPNAIIFYDGYCALCNGWITFLINRKRGIKFHFAPLGGETQQAMEKEGLGFPQADSVILYQASRFHIKAEAAALILTSLGGGWKIVGKFILLFPKSISNGVYDLIARNRYSWFGKYDTCPLPPTHVRKQFLA